MWGSLFSLKWVNHLDILQILTEEQPTLQTELNLG